MGTVKQRKSPTPSATLFPVGTKKTGNDGNMWIVEANKNGVQRWVLLKKQGTANKTVKASKTKKSTTSGFNLYYKHSKSCKGSEEGKCDPYMKEEVLYELFWRMGFPNNPEDSMSQYDRCIGFWGDGANTEAAKEVVRREYTKIKGRGAIQKFLIKDM